MKQIVFAGAVMMIMTGCRAPMPSFNLLAPYGTSRVPPPGTGTIGTSRNYYTPPSNPANPPVGTGFRPAASVTPNRWSNLGDSTASSSQDSQAAGDVAWSPTRTEPVELVDADVALSRQRPRSRVVPASQVLEHSGPIRIVQSDAIGSGTVLRGTPLTTAPHPPRTFVPSGRVVDIAATSSTRTVPAPTRAGRSDAGSTSAVDGWRSRTE